MAEGFVRGDEPAPAAAPAEPRPKVVPFAQRTDEWPVRVRLLHKPIHNERNEEIRELAFRQPTGGDINRYGNPVSFTPGGIVAIDEIKMTRMMAALSGVLPPFLEPMDSRDWASCALRLQGFFLPNPDSWV